MQPCANLEARRHTICRSYPWIYRPVRTDNRKEQAMAHHKKHGNPIPPANQPRGGPPQNTEQAVQTGGKGQTEGASFSEQDAKRRLGDFSGAGEHPYQQPGGLNDANH